MLLECFDHVPVLDPLMLLGRRVENVEIMRPATNRGPDGRGEAVGDSRMAQSVKARMTYECSIVGNVDFLKPAL